MRRSASIASWRSGASLHRAPRPLLQRLEVVEFGRVQIVVVAGGARFHCLVQFGAGVALVTQPVIGLREPEVELVVIGGARDFARKIVARTLVVLAAHGAHAAVEKL